MKDPGTVRTILFSGFEDPRLSAAGWNRLVPAGETNTVFLTWEWQRAWWETFGRGQLLLIGAERERVLRAIAPLFCDGNMIFFVGSGAADYLDFIGDTSDLAVLVALLETACQAIDGFLGFRFYHILDGSSTPGRLRSAASAIGLTVYDEGSIGAPLLELDLNGDATEKQSLVRRERWLRREGKLEIQHLRTSAEIRPHLDAFFDQHIARWKYTGCPSLFHNQTQREFYERLTTCGTVAGWMRFTRVVWNARPIACHFGFCHAGSYLWYKPTFDRELAKRSPGEVLLRQLILAAIQEKAVVFDFGIGEEAFKSRFATRVRQARTWGAYPELHHSSTATPAELSS